MSDSILDSISEAIGDWDMSPDAARFNVGWVIWDQSKTKGRTR